VKQILGVARKPVHRVDKEGVTVPRILECRFQLWALRVLAAGLVSERAVDLNSIELALRVLVDRACRKCLSSVYPIRTTRCVE